MYTTTPIRDIKLIIKDILSIVDFFVMAHRTMKNPNPILGIISPIVNIKSPIGSIY